MSHYKEAHSVAFETFLKVYMTARKARVCACEVGVSVCFSSISVHVQACVSLCVGLGGNRWEVCHVLVNKSVIVLFCPA